MVKKIIIITGGPGTGKSYMADRLSGHLGNIVTLSYDRIKELNFDRFGFDNKEQKDELNRFSLEEFFLCLRKQMWLSQNLLVEYPFYQIHKEKLTGFIKEYGYSACTVYLYGDLPVIYERGNRRNREGKRHPGHLMNQYHKENHCPGALAFDAVPTYPQFCRMMKEKEYNIMIGRSITIDVTDIGALSLRQVAEQITQEIL